MSLIDLDFSLKMDDIPISMELEGIPITEHTLKINRICQMYQTHLATGLTETPKVELEKMHKGLEDAVDHEAAFVDDLRQIFGYNEVRAKDNIWIRIQEMFSRTFDTFTCLLVFGAFMCFIGYWVQNNEQVASLDTMYLGIVLITVVFCSSIFTMYQVDKSRRIIRDFRNNIQPKALVMRDGKFAVVLARELLPGDIVSVKKGDRVPADIRVYKTVSLKVDQSIITGNPEPVTKNTKICEPDHWNIITAPNIILQRSYVVEGMCMGIVIRTGKNTLAELEQVEEKKIEKGTPIQREIQHFKADITILAFSLGILCAIIALSYGYTFIEACIFMLGLIVANVPEAMLATLSVSMAMVAKRMSRKGCYVINLQAVETVGAVSVIVAHKTSFLTMKNLQPFRVHTPGVESIFRLDLRDENLYERLESYKEIKGMREFGLALALSSSAWFVPTEDDVPMMERTVVGDSTESGILRLCALLQGDDTLELKERNKKVAELLNSLPGNREAQMSVAINQQGQQRYVDISIHQRSVDKSYFIIIKGVPRSIFTFCSHYYDSEHKRYEFSEEYREILEDEIDALSYEGEKVVALCQRNLDPKKFPEGYKFNMTEPNFPLTGYRYIGFLSLLETEKPGIQEDIEACKRAGIRLVMATIDDPYLAESMAKKVGLIQESSMGENSMIDGIDDEDYEHPRELHRIVMGQEVENMTFEQLTRVVETYKQLAFARISPDQRVKMVAALQSCGYVVAVVGGNVYDKDALLKADVGISLENEGNDLAKDNADLILVDNSLSSLLNCIEEGRLMFDNLKKFVVFTLSLNIPEVMPFIAFVTLGIPLPLGSITILFIDVVSDFVPGVSLAYEKSEQNIMSRKPRVVWEQLVNARLIYMSYGLVGFVQGIAGFFMYSIIMAEHGFLFSSLFGIRSDWENPYINDLKDSYKQEWSYPQRKSLEYLCHTGYFLAMVQVQWADLIISKTRYVSLFQQGMRNNHLNFALFFETIVAICLIYTPGTPEALRLYALSPTYWIPVIPYAFLIWIFDEWRRYLIRKYPDGFLVTLTDY